MGTALPAEGADSMTPGLVSTIIPVYNRPEQLREAVASVLAQDYAAIEIIIVDDASTDGITFEVAQLLGGTNRCTVRAVTQVNGGPGVAREHGRQLAQGEFIQYLDSDDVLLPEKFSAQVAALRSKPDADVAYGKTSYRHADGQLEPGAWKGSGREVSTMFPSFLNERWWDTPNPLYRSRLCDEAGPWSELRLEEDWEYDCRVAALGGRLVWCNQFVCEVRDHGGDRLCRGTLFDKERMGTRARSHELIWQHAVTAGLPSTAPYEVAKFSRSLFLLARQCGAAGLPNESRRLFDLARLAACDNSGMAMQFRSYAFLTGLLGWESTGRISVWVDRFRSAKQ